MTPISSDLVHEHLKRILASDIFLHSDRLRRFLQFSVEAALNADSERTKEYVVGVEVFDRGPSFDSRIDPATGVAAANLGRLYCAQKRYAEAEPLLKRALEIRELTYGPDDPVLGLLLAQYTQVLRGERKFSEAEIAEVRSTRIQVRNALRSEATQN